MTEQDERTLVAGLRALKDVTALESAPERVQKAVLTEFRASVRPARQSRIRWWAVAAAAAAVVTCFIVYTSKPRPEAPLTKIQAAPQIVTAAPEKPSTVVQTAKRKRHVRPSASRRPEPAAEVATDFLPVLAAPALQPGEHAAVVRVELPRSSLRAFGLPSSEERRSDRVNADVVLGQDGLIRAVRFIR